MLKGLHRDEREQLYFACEHHTDMLRSEDKTINTCFDADRLDLGRVGIVPLSERMASKAGSYFAEHSDVFESAKTMYSALNLE